MASTTPIRRQPHTLVPRPNHRFGSRAAQLSNSGLSPRGVDAAHPRVATPRGAGYHRRRPVRNPRAVPVNAHTSGSSGHFRSSGGHR